MRHQRQISERALVAQRMEERGYHPVLEMPMSKRPVDMGWQDGPVRDVAKRLRWNPDKNLGWKMGSQPNGKRLLALDDDGGLGALEATLGTLPPTWAQRTPSGGSHRVYLIPFGIEFSNQVRIAGHEADVKADRGKITIAPSELDDRDGQTAGIYAVTAALPLARLPERWITALRRPPETVAPDIGDITGSLSRALAYTATCDPAISGSGGHQATFRVACKCVEFGLSIAETVHVLRIFNERCQPKWQEKDLRHKAESAHGVGRVVRGGKLASAAARARGVAR